MLMVWKRVDQPHCVVAEMERLLNFVHKLKYFYFDLFENSSLKEVSRVKKSALEKSKSFIM